MGQSKIVHNGTIRIVLQIPHYCCVPIDDIQIRMYISIFHLAFKENREEINLINCRRENVLYIQPVEIEIEIA